MTSPPFAGAEATISSTAPVAVSSIALSRFVPRKLLSFPALLVVALAASIFVLDSGSIADPDIWWHLRNAEMLVNHHPLVRQDIYSFTAQGARWLNEAWLAEIPFYVGWRLMDVRGLYLVMLLEIEAILLGLFRLAYVTSRNLKASFLVTSLAVWLATVSFGPRTLLAGWICLVAELLIFTKFRQGDDRAWLLPPLFMIWINLHGSWFIGMVLFGVFFASGLVQGSWGRLDAVRWTPQQLKKLSVVGALSLGSLFVNPFGYRLIFYPLNFAFCQRLNVSHVDEWLSLDFHGVRGKILFGMIDAQPLAGSHRKTRWRLDDSRS